ncbi:Protein FAR-RED IMPAIRED RESPONSE 1 [Bienertia sinuspersici]
MWVPAYTKHLFWAGMKTTQRIEIIHSFFDEYVNKHITLAEFAEMYCREMEKRAEMERQYDAHNETFIWHIACGFPCESIFQHCNTDMKFKEIQRECSRIMFLHCFQNVVTFINVTEYTFADKDWCRNKETKKEFLTQKDVSRKHTCMKDAYQNPSKTEHVLSNDEMQLAFEPIFSIAYVFKDINHLVLEFLELLNIRVDGKRVMIETEILNQTQSSVCMKDKQVGTPASTTSKRKADCSIPTPASDRPPSSAGNEGNEGNVKNSQRKAKLAHRTTGHRYYLVVEKAIKAKSKWKTKVTNSKEPHIIQMSTKELL